MLTRTADGQTHQDEVRALFLNIEPLLKKYMNQVDRRELFLDIAMAVYEQSDMIINVKEFRGKNGFKEPSRKNIF